MTTAETVSAMRGRAVKGVMFHARMSEYFAFLDLPGFSALHDSREAEENLGAKHLSTLYIRLTGELVPEEAHTPPETIPQSWYRIRRSGTDATWRKRAVRDGMTKWRDWETETVAMLKPLYAELTRQEEIALAEEARNKILDAGEEIALADKILYDLDSADYNFAEILTAQPDLEKRFRRDLKKLYAE